MTDRMIDTDGARALSSRLTRLRPDLDDIAALVAEAETLGEEPVHIDGLLDEIDRTLAEIAVGLRVAADLADQFRLGGLLRAALGLARLPSGGRRRFDGAPDDSFDAIRQEASHNSYAVPGGIPELHANGIRTFELDIHRGAPTDFARVTPWPLGPALTFLDHRTHGGGLDGDWRVYHHSADTDSEYGSLSEGLAAIDALDTVEPITVFVDNKDPFGGEHTQVELDALLHAELGDRLFTPDDLLARAPAARSLGEAVVTAGWPTVAELDGRVIVVLTDETGDYDRRRGSAFVATKPQFALGPEGAPRLVPDPNVVIYNADESKISAEQIAAIQSDGNLLRTYFGERCEPPAVGDPAPNFRAVDHEFPENPC